MVDLQTPNTPDRTTQLVWTILAALGGLVGLVLLYRIVAG